MFDHKQLRAEITALVESGPAYALDMSFARKFAELTGRPETGVLSNVRELSAYHESKLSGREKYARAVRLACDGIWQWFQSGELGHFNTSDLISFIESHCQQCVWAVLIGEKHRELIETQHPEILDDLNGATA